ncbi:hypothetical protein Lfu02_59090 [Longispora fulva]|uniref:PH (Pleckstrin Homology) domain-containing protein n=1 Tax=Longispora fulva TaxID=619741 RepID=A0A8J7GEA3_9ACTN|nr:hypothetical protein [Longispora fulva]MBG6137109.1 hypothetical protein [Longispora fulva]GIG61537.1 hypothetical protein Lfu02_59090 [Longispora fulva]
MTRWRRPHPPDPGTVAATTAAGVFGCCAVLLTWSVVTGQGPSDWASATVPIVMTGSVAVLVWRAQRLGVFYGDRGLKVCHLWRTRVLPWPAVASVVSRRGETVGVGEGPAIWVVPCTGEEIETPLYRRRGSWFGQRSTTGKHLSPEAYDRAVRVLRQAIAAHRAG